jgi:GH25 family lysozyme M1 (1,4-beta-N-acetylmuramidase)
MCAVKETTDMLQPFDVFIDVGDAQPNIDIEIVAIKATQGATFESPTYGRQLEAVLKANKRPLPYHFFNPGPADPQVAKFLQVTALGPGKPFALDWEGRARSTAAPLIVEQAGQQLWAVAGRVPLGYWGVQGSTPATPTEKMEQWLRWVPRYPISGDRAWEDLPAAIKAGWAHEWPGAFAAQYTCWGSVPGIDGAVDRSVIYANTVEEIRAWYDNGSLPGNDVAAPAAPPPIMKPPAAIVTPIGMLIACADQDAYTAAVVAYQQGNALDDDGVVGLATMTALAKASGILA